MTLKFAQPSVRRTSDVGRPSDVPRSERPFAIKQLGRKTFFAAEEEECLPTVDLLPVYGAGSTPKDLNEIVGGDEGDGLLFVFLAGHELEEAVFA